MQTEQFRPGRAPTQDELSLWPASPLGRALLAVAALALTALAFAAWLSPNMVFDLANLVFCG